jgi:hypothetical protein
MRALLGVRTHNTLDDFEQDDTLFSRMEPQLNCVALAREEIPVLYTAQRRLGGVIVRVCGLIRPMLTDHTLRGILLGVARVVKCWKQRPFRSLSCVCL